MTREQARAILTPLGIVLRRTEYGEWRVNFKGSPVKGHPEAAAAYETDLDAAVATGRAMAAARARYKGGQS